MTIYMWYVTNDRFLIIIIVLVNLGRRQSAIICHDILCLVETHCSYSDTIDLEHYSVVNNIRPKTAKAVKHSGGLTVLVKKSLRPGISFLPMHNTEFMWLKLDKSFFKYDSGTYLAVVYISPENSSY